jgi:peptide/nickel transport system substrate-binding protein
VDDERPRHAALSSRCAPPPGRKGGFNSGYYSNPEVDALLEEARTATDQDRRAELYREMQVIVQEDAPWVFVANWVQNAVTSDRVENFALEPSFFLLLDDVVKN